MRKENTGLGNMAKSLRQEGPHLVQSTKRRPVSCRTKREREGALHDEWRVAGADSLMFLK